MNAKLLQPFTRQEVEAAFQYMGPFKSPGPDGFGEYFYQKHWHTIGTDVSNVIPILLNSEGIISSINSTFIAFIFKKQDVDSVNDLRPISLYNVIYKLAYKTITNRLKPIMNEINFRNQNIFILGRLISDNIMITHETLHSLNKLRKGKI